MILIILIFSTNLSSRGNINKRVTKNVKHEKAHNLNRNKNVQKILIISKNMMLKPRKTFYSVYNYFLLHLLFRTPLINILI